MTRRKPLPLITYDITLKDGLGKTSMTLPMSPHAAWITVARAIEERLPPGIELKSFVQGEVR